MTNFNKALEKEITYLGKYVFIQLLKKSTNSIMVSSKVIVITSLNSFQLVLLFLMLLH